MSLAGRTGKAMAAAMVSCGDGERWESAKRCDVNNCGGSSSGTFKAAT
jgi:hypothetical protein